MKKILLKDSLGDQILDVDSQKWMRAITEHLLLDEFLGSEKKFIDPDVLQDSEDIIVCLECCLKFRV